MAQGNGPPPGAEANLNARVHFPPPPPPGFDATRASPTVLDQYGIPHRPDAQAYPNAAQFWDEMFSPPLGFLQARFLLNGGPWIAIAARRGALAGQREASLNWSGAYITPRDGQQITQIHGRWHVPHVNPPAGAGPLDVFSCSTWIGLDGQRLYYDSALPQIGTTQSINDPVFPQYWAWWQWWQRDNSFTHWPAPIPIPVAPGDLMLASIYVGDAATIPAPNVVQALLILVNRTANLGMLFIVDGPDDGPMGPVGRQAWLSGATAEWVVERPTDPFTGRRHELPDYGQVHFSNAFAMTDRRPPYGVPGPLTERSLDGARLIRMYKAARAPSRTVTISKAELPDVFEFRTVFVP